MHGTRIVVLIMVAALAPSGDAARGGIPAGTAFTYQGQLKDAGVPLSGSVDLRFELFDAEVGGNPVGSPVALQDVSVAKGLFSVELDFGAAAFTGQARWAQIEVRNPHDPTDTEPFASLAPRQPLTAAPYALHSLAPWRQVGSAVSYTAGNVGIGTDAPRDSVHIVDAEPQLTLQDNDGSDAEQTGYVALRASSGFDQGRIGFTSAGDRDLTVQNFGGDVQLSTGGFARLTATISGRVGVGTTEPDVRLHVERGTDASPGGGGYIQAGETAGLNVVIDENEIMARNDGAPSNLVLNNNGGDVVVGGGLQVNGESSLDLGYEIVEATDEESFVSVSCPAGKRAIGGGCDTTNPADTIISSRPLGDGTGWHCFYESGFNAVDITVYAICVNVQ